MLDTFLALSLLVLIGAIVVVVARPEADEGDATSDRQARRTARVPWPALVTAMLVAIVVLLLGAPVLVAISAALLVGSGCHVLLSTWIANREVAFEMSIAASLDLVVASLRAGAALLPSLDSAAAESRGKVGEMLSGLCDRLRLGEATDAALADMIEEYPSEGVRLVAFTLGAHLDSGGSAATSLAVVAGAIRDRIDVIRRSNSQSAETQASVIGILAITYGLALMMWRQYPDRVETFAGSPIGQTAIAASILLQALGLLWIWSMTRVEV